MRDENGLEKCVACGLCAVACPADAIYLEAAENDGSVMAGPRYAKVYQIHKTRCIFCGYCEEACPVSAIFMGKDYETAVYSNKDFIWDKTDMLVPRPPARKFRRAIARQSPRHGDTKTHGVFRRTQKRLCESPCLESLWLTNEHPDEALLSRCARRARARVRRRDGHDALRPGRLHQPVVRRAEPVAARPGGRGPPRLPARGRGRHRDQHVRRQPREAGGLRPRRPAARDQPARRADRARRGARARLGGRRHRPARHPHRALRAAPASTKPRATSRNRRRRCSRAAWTCSSSRRSATSTRSARPSPPCDPSPTCRSSRR